MELFICLRAVGGICFGLDLNCVSGHVCNMPWFVSLGGTHATHIPPVNDHLLSSRRRRHPPSTSHREPVVHGLFSGSVHSSAQCFLYSDSAAVGHRSK